MNIPGIVCLVVGLISMSLGLYLIDEGQGR